MAFIGGSFPVTANGVYFLFDDQKVHFANLNTLSGAGQVVLCDANGVWFDGSILGGNVTDGPVYCQATLGDSITSDTIQYSYWNEADTSVCGQVALSPTVGVYVPVLQCSKPSTVYINSEFSSTPDNSQLWWACDAAGAFGNGYINSSGGNQTLENFTGTLYASIIDSSQSGIASMRYQIVPN